MEIKSPKEDMETRKAFGVILSIESFSAYILEIAKLIYDNELSPENLKKVLSKYNIISIEDVKEELLDLLIVNINLILNDHLISDKEKHNFERLKKYFKIREGDFYSKRFDEVKDILNRQFERLYLDNSITEEEAIHNVELQELFDLSYDQFDEFRAKQVGKAIEKGANISELDTAKYPKEFKESNIEDEKEVWRQIKEQVWNRDHGRCQECGSDELLDLDHLIPLSKGGSNTYRNIQLICEPCKKTKSERSR